MDELDWWGIIVAMIDVFNFEMIRLSCWSDAIVVELMSAASVDLVLEQFAIFGFSPKFS